MNHKLTGNARRESYAHCPMPRMTNTYMLDGKFKKEEILSTVKNGIYAANFGGGQVDIMKENLFSLRLKHIKSKMENCLILSGRYINW